MDTSGNNMDTTEKKYEMLMEVVQYLRTRLELLEQNHEYTLANDFRENTDHASLQRHLHGPAEVAWFQTASYEAQRHLLRQVAGPIGRVDRILGGMCDVLMAEQEVACTSDSAYDCQKRFWEALKEVAEAAAHVDDPKWAVDYSDSEDESEDEDEDSENSE